MTQYPSDVARYAGRLFDQTHHRHACRIVSAEELARWQVTARAEYLDLLRLPRIAEQAAGHVVAAALDDGVEDMGHYTRRRGWVQTEPDVRIAFWLLRPVGNGPFPLALTPHGHENGDTYVGIAHNDKTRRQIEHEDQDVAVQAVSRGFLTIAPATRGIGSNPRSFRLADVAQRHDGRDCRCHNWHALIAGRTLMGERVWDLMRLLDWAMTLKDVNPRRVLMMGNSGGGMATLHTAAADPRIGVAVASCSFNNFVSPEGILRHCPCNTVPGMLTFGEYWDVAALIAPRHLLTVNGRHDPAHPAAEVQTAADRLRAVYTAAGCGQHHEHRFGEGEHRFFAPLMWDWVQQAFQSKR